MSKLTHFDPHNVTQLRREMNEALAAIATRHGISLKVDRVTYGPDAFRATVQAETIRTAADADKTPFGETHKWTRAFRTHAKQFGLEQADLGREVTFGNKRAVIGGITLHGREPIVLKIGNKYALTSAREVCTQLGRPVPETILTPGQLNAEARAEARWEARVS